MKYILYVNCSDKVVEHPLPAINNRKCSVSLVEIAPDCCFSLEVFDDVWKAFSTEKLRLFSDDVTDGQFCISDGTVIHAVYGGIEFVLIFRELSDDVVNFRKFDIGGTRRITIGSSDECDIVINDRFVSEKHAFISRVGDDLYIADNSTNGTFVNGMQVNADTKLKIFDEIYIVGVKLVNMGNIIAVNGASRVECRLPEADMNRYSRRDRVNNGKSEYYAVSPRMMNVNEMADVTIEPPPPKGKRSGQPLIFLLGPTITMPMPVLIYSLMDLTNKGDFSLGNLAVAGANVIVTAAVGLGWAIAQRNYDRKSFDRSERQRVEEYENYLKKISMLLTDKHVVFRNYMLSSYMSSQEYAGDPNAELWNRYSDDKDFLSIRIGRGAAEYSGKITASSERFSAKNDLLEEKAVLVYQKYRYIDDAVTLLDLRENGVIGVTGSEDSVRNIGMNMMLQIAALHNYSDVKIAVISDNEHIESYRWSRWLPHVFTDDRKLRLICDETTGSQNVLFHLTEMLRSRSEHSEMDNEPHYVIFCTNPRLIENEMIEKFVNESACKGITFVLLYGRKSLLPRSCSMIINDSEEYRGILYRDRAIGRTDTTKFDLISADEAEKFAKRISGYRTRSTKSAEIPSVVDFFAGMGIKNISQWDLVKKYKENRVYEHMRAFIGVAAENRQLFLDIHEKKHGPHGLIAGTTGSGKSEVLQTFILSLALNYSPDEVSFVIIDYKGGGMANSFEALPHISGIITNLSDRSGSFSESSDNQTKRALIAIKSEIRRRQAIFNTHNINHIDTYIKSYRSGNISEPLPHLIVISDEFAELKKENPDFIRELVSAARIGRSLGIHLILATQKPAGVVDDEIWSNSRFKICLRVQDKQDSIGMLRRPDAASIVHTGRAYLQVGNNEIFDMFQSAYSGGKYVQRNSTAEFTEDMGIIELDGTSPLMRKKKKTGSGHDTQVSTAVKYIKETCERNGIAAAKKIWLPPLPEQVYYDDVISGSRVHFDNSVTTVFGLVDNMEKQCRYPAQIDLRKCGNLLICGNSSTGKSTLLQTMLYSLCTNYSPEMFQCYLMDFSGRSLKLFRDIPHCGCVAFPEDEIALKGITGIIEKKIEERRRLFNLNNVAGYEEYLAIDRMPLIAVVIDNYPMFAENSINENERLIRIMRDGPACGIQVILTASHSSDVRFRVRKNISDTIALRLADKAEYFELFDSRPVVSSSARGRGIIRQNNDLLEFQTALVCGTGSSAARYTELLEKVRENAVCGDGSVAAEQVRNIPANESFEEFYSRNRMDGYIPVGYDTASAVPVGFRLRDVFCFGVYSDADGVRAGLEKLEEMLTKENAHCIRITENECNYEKLSGILADLKIRFRERYNAEDGSYGGHIAVIIKDFESFVSAVYSQDNPERLYPLTEKLFREGKGCNICFYAGFTPDADIGTDRSDICFTDAYKAFVSYNCGLLLGIPFGGQSVFTCSDDRLADSVSSCYFDGRTGFAIHIPGGRKDD